MAVVSYSEFKNNPANYFLVVFSIEALRNDGYEELTAIAGFDWYWDDQLIDVRVIDITGSMFKGAATGWIRYVPTGVRSLPIEHKTSSWRYIADYDVVFDRTKLKDLNASVSVDELTTYLTERIEQPDISSINSAPKFIELTAYYQLLVCRYVQCNKLPTPEMQKTQLQRDLISLQSLELASVNARELALKQLQAYHHFQHNAHNYICASFSVPKDTEEPHVEGFMCIPGKQITQGQVNFRFEATSKRQILVPYQLGHTTTIGVYQVEIKPGQAYRSIMLADIKRSVTELTGLDDDLEAKFPDGGLLGYSELEIKLLDSIKFEQPPESVEVQIKELQTEDMKQKAATTFALKSLDRTHQFMLSKFQRQQQMLESRQRLNIDANEFGLVSVEVSEAALQPENETLAEPDNITSAVTSIETAPVVEATVPQQAELPNENDQPQTSATAVAKHQIKCLFPQNATIRYISADAHNLSLIDYGALIFDKLKAECPALADALAKDELSEVLYWDRFCLKLNELLQLSQLFVQLQKEPSFKQHTVSFFMSAAGKNKDEAAAFDSYSKMDVLHTLLKQQNFPIARLVVHTGFENKRHDRVLQLIFVSGARFELNFSYGMAFFEVKLPDDLATVIAEVNNQKEPKKRKAMLGPMLAELQVDFRPLGVLGKSASMTIAVTGFSPVVSAAQQD